MSVKSYILMIIVILQLTLLFVGALLTIFGFAKSMLPFTIAVWFLLFVSIIVGWFE